MPVIKPNCVRDVKLRASLADVVSRVVTLRKAGGTRLKGLCPFHNEKTPSFNVDTDKGFYKCFGCGKAGDAITFVRETEQLSFTEAIEALGQRFGIVIEYEEGSGGPTRADRTLRQEVFDLHEVAADHFSRHSRPRMQPANFSENSGSSSGGFRPNSRTNSRSVPSPPTGAASAPR
jgi:DNA primase